MLTKYIDVMNRILRAAPAGMTVALHHCRGNNAGMWQSREGYEAVAEPMFHRATLEAKSYLLEYDTPRAGDFAPLQVPAEGQGGDAGAHLDQDQPGRGRRTR